jgi:quercetin dioxygenase-like cupin family protein
MHTDTDTDTTYDQFRDAALAQGFDEVLVREWQPDLVQAEHTHPFAVQVRVVRGAFWLDCAGQTRHVPAGSGFELAAGVPHSERYGPDGATFWVARRNPR